ncbi:MAG: hypothetical protein RTU30_04625 [Candidatus Thorarchaeota archaeon]
MNRRTRSVIFLAGFFVILFVAPVNACTIFMASMDGIVLAGNNEDWAHANFTILFVPALGTRNGYVLITATNNTYDTRVGMNDHGFYIDAASVRPAPLDIDYNKSVIPQELYRFFLQRCDNVYDAIEIFEEYTFLLDEWDFQFLVADSNGDSVVIGIGPDRTIEYTWKDDYYHLVTNGNIAYPELGQSSWSEWRYNTANESLSAISHPDNVSVDYFTDVLESVHHSTYTAYSNIFDLVNLEIYTYYLHDFTRYIRFSLAGELAKGAHSYDLQELFHTPSTTTESTSINSSTTSPTIMTTTSVTSLTTPSTSTTIPSEPTTPSQIGNYLLIAVSLGFLGIIVIFVVRKVVAQS